MSSNPTVFGDYPMPAAWWRLDDALPLQVRVSSTTVPGLPMLAFAEQFDPSLSVYGGRYLNLAALTCWVIDRPADPAHQVRRNTYLALQDAFPDTFTTVIGGSAHRSVWLVLPILRLTDRIADDLNDRIHRARTGA